jgi:hypothetical protein
MIDTACAKDFSSEVGCEPTSRVGEISALVDGFCVDVMFLILDCSRG